MASTHGPQVVNPGRFEPSKTLKTVYAVLIFIGVLTFAFGLFKDQERTWHAYLVSFFYFTSLALGGLFFAAIQHATKAGWSITVRRIAEGFTSYLPVAAVTAAILMFGTKYLYQWFDLATVAADSILTKKSAYLNPTFFTVRMVIFFALWLYFAKVLVGRSLEQDRTGEDRLTLKNVGTSIAFIIVFTLSYSLFSVDTLMSLEPHWFSTIFGVYTFAGLFQATIAFMVLVTVFLLKSRLVKGLITDEHLHDLAKFMKAFTVFWAYIAFSQFMLIWYANLPEETVFYYHRSHGAWTAVSLSLLVFRFIVPFLALLPRNAKRNYGHVTVVAILILIMQFVDLYWIVYPNYNEETAAFSFLEIGVFAGFLGLFLWRISQFFHKNPLVPLKDPRIEEALNHHVIY